MAETDILENQGRSCLGVFYIENQNRNKHTISKLNCSRNTVTIGSCLFWNSNDDLAISDSVFEKNFGTPLKFLSRTLPTLTIKNLVIKENEVDPSQEGQSIIDLHLTILVFIGEENLIKNNSVLSSLISLKDCEASFESLTFIGNQNKLKEASVLAILSKNSSVYLNKINFSHNPVLLGLFGFANFEGGSLRLISSIFENCTTRDFSCIFVDSALVEVKDCIFKNSKGARSGSIYVAYSNLTIVQSNFINGSVYDDEGSFPLFNDPNRFSNALEVIAFALGKGLGPTLIINNSNFKAFFQGHPLLDIERFRLAHLINTTFSNFNKIGLGGEGVLISKTATIIINCLFEHFEAFSGAAAKFLNLDSSKTVEIQIERSRFERNQAMVGGAILFLGRLIPNLTENLFIFNKALMNSSLKAGIGGCIYFSCLSCHSVKLLTLGNSFEGNFAENYGPNIFSQAMIEQSPHYPDSYRNNSDRINFTNTSSSLPLKVSHSPFNTSLHIASESDIFQNNIWNTVVSGSEFDFFITLKDHQGQILYYDSLSRSRLRKEENSSVKITNIFSQTSSGFHYFSKVKINTKPNSHFLLYVDLEFIEAEIFPFILETNLDNQKNLTLNVFARPCKKRGDFRFN